MSKLVLHKTFSWRHTVVDTTTQIAGPQAFLNLVGQHPIYQVLITNWLETKTTRTCPVKSAQRAVHFRSIGFAFGYTTLAYVLLVVIMAVLDNMPLLYVCSICSFVCGAVTLQFLYLSKRERVFDDFFMMLSVLCEVSDSNPLHVRLKAEETGLTFFAERLDQWLRLQCTSLGIVIDAIRQTTDTTPERHLEIRVELRRKLIAEIAHAIRVCSDFEIAHRTELQSMVSSQLERNRNWSNNR